jgi:amino acid transporter
MVENHWGARGGVAFILITTCNAAIGGSSYIFTAACQVAAFARDSGLPFAEKLAYINPTTNIPIYSWLLLILGTLLILLFGLSTLSGSIIFSLAVIANLWTMAIPIGLRQFACLPAIDSYQDHSI